MRVALARRFPKPLLRGDYPMLFALGGTIYTAALGANLVVTGPGRRYTRAAEIGEYAGVFPIPRISAAGRQLPFDA